MITPKLVKPSVRIVSSQKELEAGLDRVVSMGRICYQSVPKDSTKEGRDNFIRALISRQHESVLEHGSMTVVLVTDRSVTHQLVRHRLSSYSQESQRYCNYALNKFDSQILFLPPMSFPNWSEDMKKSFMNHLQNSCDLYEKYLKEGVRPEVARAILPQCTKTQIAVTANFREWRTIMKLRCEKHAQAEIRALMYAIRSATLHPLGILWEGITMDTNNIIELPIIEQ